MGGVGAGVYSTSHHECIVLYVELTVHMVRTVHDAWVQNAWLRDPMVQGCSKLACMVGFQLHASCPPSVIWLSASHMHCSETVAAIPPDTPFRPTFSSSNLPSPFPQIFLLRYYCCRLCAVVASSESLHQRRTLVVNGWPLP